MRSVQLCKHGVWGRTPIWSLPSGRRPNVANIRLYIGKLYRDIFRLLLRFNKYLLFRSKYLYLGTRKVLRLPKVSTKQVIEDLTTIELYDGKGDITDDMFEEQMDLVLNVVKVGDKVVDLRHLPKGYIILRRGGIDMTFEEVLGEV